MKEWERVKTQANWLVLIEKYDKNVQTTNPKTEMTP